MLFFLRTLVAAVAVLPFASAFIDNAAPYSGTYKATAHSKFPVTFTAGHAPGATYHDLIVYFGLATPNEIAASQNKSMGTPLPNATIDLVAHDADYLGHDRTFWVPLHSAAFPKKSGNYVLVAVVLTDNVNIYTPVPVNIPELRTFYISFKAVKE
ncbi:hypothetical protein BKA62DRAFT_670342 [Auriculariales sp. MPI-PUGE-AT-0066]|nr:hypothetical protein BKA62DRAFT_670342 [Auriculariales sp. MPI-PUGE-AT-0066]